MSKATEALMAELHGALANKMKAMLEGDDPLTASDLGAIRQFLKDNGIQTDGEGDENLKGMADDLPDLDDEDSNVSRFPQYGG